ncbi:MAG TPA: type II secretion system protein GspC [Polyangiaceae bacterium]|jgi:general secretion pathway protein C|nr:type II secretion system protein GspC [Polyangiaceae bacterium]
MGFDTALRRYFAGVILALIAVAAYFQAAGVTQLAGSALAPDDKGLAGPPRERTHTPAPVSSAADDHATSARWIMERNPFDSVTPRPLDAPPVVDAGDQAVVDLEHYENAPTCDGVKALIIVAAADPGWSMAALAAGGTTQTKLVRVGDEIGAGRVVQIIEWNRVVLSLGSALCQMQMFKPSKPAGTAAAPAPTPPPAPAAAVVGGATPVPADIASKIQKVSGNEFNVDRQVVDKILENQAELMKSARIVPEQENGKVVGIRLFGIRPDTLLGTLGLENGDRLQSINGFDMASPEKALEAYARLRTADHLTVQVNRRGQNQNIDFNIK